MRLARSVSKMTIILALLAIAFGCVTSPAPVNDPVENEAASVFLANNIHGQDYPDKGGVISCKASYANWTNPGKGHTIISVNEKVIVTTKRGLRGRALLLTSLSDGKQIHMEFNERNMNMSMEAYIDLITSAEPVDLAKFSEKDRKGIDEGKADFGMTKEGIRIALGYPATHRTPTLESNKWIYWQHRWKTLIVEFGPDGKVNQIAR